MMTVCQVASRSRQESILHITTTTAGGTVRLTLPLLVPTTLTSQHTPRNLSLSLGIVISLSSTEHAPERSFPSRCRPASSIGGRDHRRSTRRRRRAIARAIAERAGSTAHATTSAAKAFAESSPVDSIFSGDDFHNSGGSPAGPSASPGLHPAVPWTRRQATPRRLLLFNVFPPTIAHATHGRRVLAHCCWPTDLVAQVARIPLRCASRPRGRHDGRSHHWRQQQQ